MMEEGGSTLQTITAQQQRHGERLSVLETQMNEIKTKVRSIEETLKSQFSFLCKHLGISVPVVPSTNFTPDLSSTDAATSKSEETNPIAAVDEEANDSLELELIPHFFFIETDDVDFLHGQFEENSKLEINCFSELSPVTIDKMKDIEIRCVKFFEENYDISESLMEFFLLHNRLLHMDCFGLHYDYTRSLFDRGKSTVISSFTYEKLLLQLLLNLGYVSDWRFINSVPLSCANYIELHVAKKMFVQMTDRGRFLLFLFARVNTEISYEHCPISKDIIILDRKLNCNDCVTLLLCYTRLLFDRGKETEFGLRKYSEILSNMDVCLVLLGDYYIILVPELTPDHEYWSASWSYKNFSATWKMLGKILDIVRLKSNSVLTDPFFSVTSLYDGGIFDRGKDIGPINGCSVEFNLDLIASCLFVLHICSLLRDASNGNFVYELFFRHGLQLHTLCIKYILLVFKTGDTANVFMRCLQFRMWRKELFPLQLEFGLFHEITVRSLRSMVVTQILLESFACIIEFIALNTLTILHCGFLYMQSWSPLHLVLWLPLDHFTLFNQLTGSSAFFKQTSSQMSQVVRSVGDFSYENLIFMLIPSLGYHLDFADVQFIVLLCVTDADIVDKKALTVSMAANGGLLCNLAENVWWSLNCGDAYFLLQLILAQGLHRATAVPATKFCVTTLGEGMHVYPHAADLQFSYYAGLNSDGCCRILSLVSHIMRGYIQFALLGEVLRTQSWVTVHYTPHVLVCADAHILLTLLTIILTKVYFFRYTILLTSMRGRLPATAYIRLIFDRGKEIENDELCSSYASNLSKLYFTSCLLTSNGLNFTDPCAGKSAHELILEFGYHLVLLFGVFNVFEFVINGERCNARQLVTELPHQVYIPWFILTLLARNKECGGVPHLHIFQFCLFARSKCCESCDRYFMESSG